MTNRTDIHWTKVIRPVSFSPRILVSGLRELIYYRDLLLTLTIHRIRVRYKQSLLGIAWAVLQPVLLMVVYTIIFSIVTRVPHEGAPYAVFVYAALLPWTFFATSLTTASGSLVSHNNLITKVYFPREILPLTYVLAALFDFAMASAVLAVLLAIYHVAVTPGIILVVPLLLIAFVFAVSLSLILSALQTRFRDIGIAISLLMQLWMFATPVVYPLSVVPKRYLAVYLLNPMAGVVENFRQIVLLHAGLNWSALMPGVSVSLLMLPLAYLYFKTAEATMADVI